jgi:hypothetical protein
VNATCHQWVFDKSVFTSTIVTDVSYTFTFFNSVFRFVF